MTKKPVLSDVAARAGVSMMTASRALRGAAEVSDKTREKVMRAARELGYVPNRIAGALSSHASNLVGVVVPSLESLVFPKVLSGISAGLAGSALKPFVGVTGYDLDEEAEVIREMLSWKPSGLIVAGLEHSEAGRRLLQAAPCPVVEVMDVDGTPVSHCVGISHRQAGGDMGREIVARGHRRIGFIGTKMPQDFRAQKRLDGFKAALAEAGLQLAATDTYSGGSSVEQGRNLTAAMLGRHPDLDCIYYSSDLMAIGGLMHCLAHGLSVPGDLALAGFNNLELLRGLPVRLATTDSHRYEIGHRAARIVRERRDRDAPPVIEALTPTLSPGDSL